jgi:tRNA pseudouridine55 synthase
VRQKREPVDGVLLLDKPQGISSQTAVSRVKNLYNAAKAGHTGTLDPMATGLLPIAFGEATKFSSALLDARKGYRAIVRLGTTTTTGDLEGTVTSSSPVDVDRALIDAVLDRFRGPLLQTPPMYSALKHEGKALYTYARAGQDIPREPRNVTIYVLDVEDYQSPDLTIAVHCSKGTYIRVLAEDIGKALGCGATLAGLRRTDVGRFAVADAVSFELLEAIGAAERTGHLLPVDAMVTELAAVELSSAASARVALGQAVDWEGAATNDLVRLYGPDGIFLGIADAHFAGSLRPRRLVATRPMSG